MEYGITEKQYIQINLLGSLVYPTTVTNLSEGFSPVTKLTAVYVQERQMKFIVNGIVLIASRHSTQIALRHSIKLWTNCSLRFPMGTRRKRNSGKSTQRCGPKHSVQCGERAHCCPV